MKKRKNTALPFSFLTFIYTIRKDRSALRLQNSLSSTNSHNSYSYLNDFPSQIKQLLLYLGKLIQMFVHVFCDLSRNLLFHIHIGFFQIIEFLILLIHGHKLVVGTLFSKSFRCAS